MKTEKALFSLAIIIPAFKIDFFEKALFSLANQTNKQFVVYVGDDASPEDIESVCLKFKNQISIVYHRFKQNLGKKDLVGHWNRCLGLINNEEWIWLFSDDDVAEPDCVSCFYKALANTDEAYDAYRFDVLKIDGNGSLLGILPESPVLENSYNLAYNILLEKRGVGIVDHIYRKAKFDENKGYINFIFAQASDWATSIRFSNPNGIYTIKGPKVRWRYSSENISGRAYLLRKKAIFGHLQFLEWMKNEFKLEANYAVMEKNVINFKTLEQNLWKTLKYHYRGIPLIIIWTVAQRIKKILKWNLIQSLVFCIKINYSVYIYYKKNLN